MQFSRTANDFVKLIKGCLALNSCIISPYYFYPGEMDGRLNDLESHQALEPEPGADLPGGGDPRRAAGDRQHPLPV